MKAYIKALAGFIAPGIVLLPAAALPVSDGGTTVTGYELLAALAVCVTTAAGVAVAPKNKPRHPGA
jgi:hypothetical protein